MSSPAEETIAVISSCALDEAGGRAQRARYARLAQNVTSLERRPEALLVDFDRNFDRETLEQALAVERECCPFFRFDFDTARRRLRVTVAEREQLPALDAIAYALRA